MPISKQTLDSVIEAFNEPNRDPYNVLRNVLELCPAQLSIQFAYDCAMSVKHLIADERSLAALDAVREHLETGKPVEQAVVDAAVRASSAAAYAASAASAADAAAAHAAAAAAADAAASAAASAASAYIAAAYIAAASAADAAASAAVRAAAAYYAAAAYTNTYNDRMIELVIELKKLILVNVALEDSNFLLEVLM